MSEQLTREQRLAKGECLTSSSIIKTLAEYNGKGVIFAVRNIGGDVEMVRIDKPKRK